MATDLMPRSFIISARTSPSRASDGAVRKNRPLLSTVDNPGDVADGEMSTTPFGMATFLRTALVAPEQVGPTMPETLSEVTRRSAPAVAAPESTQVSSPRTGVIFVPLRNAP